MLSNYQMEPNGITFSISRLNSNYSNLSLTDRMCINHSSCNHLNLGLPFIKNQNRTLKNRIFFSTIILFRHKFVKARGGLRNEMSGRLEMSCWKYCWNNFYFYIFWGCGPTTNERVGTAIYKLFHKLYTIFEKSQNTETIFRRYVSTEFNWSWSALLMFLESTLINLKLKVPQNFCCCWKMIMESIDSSIDRDRHSGKDSTIHWLHGCKGSSRTSPHWISQLLEVHTRETVEQFKTCSGYSTNLYWNFHTKKLYMAKAMT